jgi:hypothetical protein
MSCRYAGDGDLVLLTNNASDFRRLYAAQPLHAGLIILIPVVGRALQQKLLPAALDELAGIGQSTPSSSSISTATMSPDR